MLAGKVIALVEDDLALLEMYSERIKAEGATVIQAIDGEDALAKIKESKPHIVLLDMMMPKLNGLEVLAKLKEDPDVSSIPVIILTALNDESKRQAGMSAGAIDYIVKADVLPSDVIAKISKALENEDKK